MINVTFNDKICHLIPFSYFKLVHGVRPSFGCFALGASDAQSLVSSGTPGDLVLDAVTLKKIYPIRCEVGDALNPSTARLYLADERITWPFYYGTQDYNTYKLDRTQSRDIDGGEKDFALDNLNGEDEWTFTEVFDDVFQNVLSLGANDYTLTFQAVGGDAPTRKPRNIRGKNIPAPEILQQLLFQANCFLAVDLLSDPPHYSVLPLGDSNEWQSSITYRKGETVLKGGVHYYGLLGDNQANDPELSPTYWTKLIPHKKRDVSFSPKVSRGDTAKLLVGKPFKVDDGFYETQGSETGIGGTGSFYIPSPFEAFYEGSTLKNSAFLTDMGNEIAKEYKNSFQNNWYKLSCAGALPLVLCRGAQKIMWELSPQKGFITYVHCFRPREEPFPEKHTLFAYSKYWLGSSGGGVQPIWAEVTETLSHGSSNSYTVQKIDESGNKDGNDIVIDRALGYEGHGSDGEDIRNYSPWFGVGARVPIAQHHDTGAGGLKWFINLTLTFVGKPADRSLDIEEVTTASESEYRTMAVWK